MRKSLLDVKAPTDPVVVGLGRILVVVGVVLLSGLLAGVWCVLAKIYLE